MNQKHVCPKPTKIRYKTERRAVNRLAALVQAGSGQQRIYLCVCGGWHTTSQSVRRRTGEETPLPAGFIPLVTWPGHEPGVPITRYYFPFLDKCKTSR